MATFKQDRWNRFSDIHDLSAFPFLGMDAIRFLLGDKIGEGAYRAVFSFDMIPNSVLKVCVKETPANILEMEVWNQAKDTAYEKWFAPCLHISPEGNYLIQKRCRSIKDTDNLPKTLPDFFTDIKRSNFGFIGSQLVCHDYQFISRALDLSMNAKRPVIWDK